MGFKSNYENVSQGTLKPEGDYECIIQKIEERTAQSGKQNLNISLVIRNDVQQGFKNGIIFHTIWKKKEPSQLDEQVKGYNFNQIMALGKAAQLPEGRDYDTLNDFCEDLVNRPVKVRLKHEEYNGKTYERVHYLNPTAFPQVRHTAKGSPNINNYSNNQNARYADTVEVIPTADDDLPF